MKNNYKIIDDYVEIYMKRRKEDNLYITYISLEDFEKVLKYNTTWHLMWDNNAKCFYAGACIYSREESERNKRYKSLYLTQVIYDFPKGILADHINHNTLDNRRSNIRPITNSNNSKNRKGKNSNNKSGIRNMCWMGKYLRLQLQIDGKNYLFSEKFTEDQINEAKIFAEEMRKKYYGDYAGEN
jgi:hypothetical protein